VDPGRSLDEIDDGRPPTGRYGTHNIGRDSSQPAPTGSRDRWAQNIHTERQPRQRTDVAMLAETAQL